jgi:cytidyltransferase-like protein
MEMKLFKIGLIVGRFQPLTIWHIRLIEKALDECCSVAIGIGSAQEQRTDINPFTWEERKKMLTNYFGRQQKNMKIFPINDINNLPYWARHCLNELCRRGLYNNIDCYYSGSGQNAQLFANERIMTQIMKRKPEHSATNVRNMLKSNGPFEYFVPSTSYKILRAVYKIRINK